MQNEPLIKFAKPDNKAQEEPFFYGTIYEEEEGRIKISADKDQTDLLLNLTDNLNPPYFVLYVLVVSRLSNELGRYQSPLFETKAELAKFLNTFRVYFETDARHHIWIGTTDDSGLLVYDQHNVIYAYGNEAEYITLLEKDDYKNQKFSFPAPHIHYYHQENDIFEQKLIDSFDWDIFPLCETDMY